MKGCIDQFEVDLDISDCSCVYDYATGRKVTRDDGQKWTNEMFKTPGGADHAKENDKKLKLRVKLMDMAINSTEKLQRKMGAKEQEDCNFHGDFDATSRNIALPRRMLPVYHPGDIVKGRVKLTLNKAVQPKHLSINLLGEACVTKDISSSDSHQTITETETFVDADQMLWTKTGTGSGAGKSEERSSLVHEIADSGKEIPAGEHSWPFEFQIPIETSQTSANLLPHGFDECYVIYRLKAALSAGKLLKHGDVASHKGIWVEKPIDIAADPENLNPVDSEKTIKAGLFFKSGNISIKAMLPYKAFIKWKEIPLSVEIDNQTSAAIKMVTARIMLLGTCRARSNTTSIKVKASKKSMEEDFPPGVCPLVNLNLPWDFSESIVDSNLMPAGTMDDCKLIDVRFEAMVKVKRSGLHKDIELQIPFFVGTFNSKEQLNKEKL